MSELSILTGAPIVVELGGKEYRMSPLDLNDQGELDRFVEAYPIERAKRLIAKLPDNVPTEIVDKIWADAIDPNVNSRLIISALSCSAAIALQVWLSIRHNHPNVDKKIIDTAVTMDRREEIQNKLNEANGIIDDEEDNGLEKNPPSPAGV